MKTVNYGGLVTFRIPAAWVEDYSEKDCGLYHDKSDSEGTLRLSLLTARSPARVDAATPAAVLRSLPACQGHPAESISDGTAMVRFSEKGNDRGQRIWTQLWYLAHALPPKHVRIAIFSFTVPELQANAPVSLTQVRVLDREIAASTFGGAIGK